MKQYSQNRTFKNEERKFYQQVGGDDTNIYQQPDARETGQFLSKIRQPREHSKNWIINMAKKFEGLDEGTKAEIHIDLLRMTLKKYQIGSMSGHDGIHGFWFKKFTTTHETLALEMNRCLQEAHVPEWITKGMAILIQKETS